MKPNVVEVVARGGGRAWRWLGSPGVLVGLIIALLALLALGTLLPQLPTIASGPDQIAEWNSLAQARYGPLAPLLKSVGAFRLYGSPLLWTLTALMAAATLSCTLRRWPGRWRGVFGRPAWSIAHSSEADPRVDAYASHTATIDLRESHRLGTDEDRKNRLKELGDAACRTLKRYDYRVRSETTPDLIWMQGDRNRLAGLGSLVDHLAVLVVLVGVCLTLVLGWRKTLTIDPSRTAPVDYGSGITLRNDGFEIERYQDGSPAAYVAHIAIESRSATDEQSIGVNEPAHKGGVWYYLQGYREEKGAYTVTLLAVHDPGYGVVILGGLLFLASTLVTLYFPRSSVTIRIATPSETLRLIGWADDRAYNFDQEFADLATDLQREWESEADSPAARA